MESLSFHSWRSTFQFCEGSDVMLFNFVVFSIPLCICSSVFPSIYFSKSLNVGPSVSLCVDWSIYHLSDYWSICPFIIFLSAYWSTCPSICLSVDWSICPSIICQSVYWSICLSIICLSVYWSIGPSVCLSDCWPTICPSTHLFIHLSGQ